MNSLPKTYFRQLPAGGLESATACLPETFRFRQQQQADGITCRESNSAGVETIECSTSQFETVMQRLKAEGKRCIALAVLGTKGYRLTIRPKVARQDDLIPLK